MCQYGDFEHWRFDGPPAVHAERNREPSYTVRVFLPGGAFGDVPLCRMTAEPDGDDPACCHVKGVDGVMPPGTRAELAKLFLSWGYESARWERIGPDGKLRSHKYSLKRFMRED